MAEVIGCNTRRLVIAMMIGSLVALIVGMWTNLDYDVSMCLGIVCLTSLLVRKAGVSTIDYISHRSNENQLMSAFSWWLLKTRGVADEWFN